MTFSSARPAAIAACAAALILAGCSKGEAPAPETPAAKQPVAAASSPGTPTPAAQPAPSVNPEDVFADLPPPYNAASYSGGKRQFRLCQSCHQISADHAALVGPTLYGLFGREVGSIEGFKYSKALQDADFTWSPDQLEQWLASPRDFLPGNAMSFAGIRKEKDRHDLIAYLMVETAPKD